MQWYKNYLASEVQPWARQVQKEIDNVKANFQSAEVNNVKRDDQLASSLRQVQSAANAASDASTQATAAAAQANTAATNALAAANTANTSLNGLVSLGSDGSSYSVHGGNITANTITANEISSAYVYAGNLSAGQITSGSLSADFISGGTIDASNISGVTITGTTITGGSINSSGTFSTSSGGSTTTLGNGTLSISGPGGTGGISSLTGYGIVLQSSNEILVSAANGISGPKSSFDTHEGNGFVTVRDNTVSGSSFPANVFISSANGNMARKTDASERRLKENIENFEFDTDAFISINPVTFNYKRDAVSTDEQAEALNVGFILDDFEQAGISDFLVYQAEGDSFKQLRYDLLAIYLHKVVQTQNEKIKTLEARLEALENRVQ